MRLLIVSDSGVPSGYGRIADEIGMRLHERGILVRQVSLQYDGLLPPIYDGKKLLPYHVASVAGHAEWPLMTTAIIQAMQPEAVLVIQDMPYVEQVRLLPVDWSKIVFGAITPIDGKPLHPNWVRTLKGSDAVWSISQFGVDTMREAGIRAELCRPGIDPDTFFRKSDEERKALRLKAGIDPDAFVLGSCAQNQGRKLWPMMLELFFKFAQDKPTARFIANTEPKSPVGWDLPSVCEQRGWDTSKVLFRPQLGGLTIAERYNLMDAHIVLASREGFGLPLVEAQACGAVSMALDYCSGTEICGDGRGILIPPLELRNVSTWGGAEDRYPDMAVAIERLEWLYANPAERLAIAKRGHEHSRGYVWVQSTDTVHQGLLKLVDLRRAQLQAVKQLSTL